MSSRTAARAAFEKWWNSSAAKELQGIAEESAWRIFRAAWWSGTEHVPSAREPWTAVEERLPDDDITVMVALKDSDEPVWFGYHDEAGWHSATDGAPITSMVTHWKPTPEGPHG